VAAGKRARRGTIDRSSGMGEAQGAKGARARAQALEALHAAAVAVWHLQRALAKKRDPLSHVAFADALAAAGAPLLGWPRSASGAPARTMWELLL